MGTPYSFYNANFSNFEIIKILERGALFTLALIGVRAIFKNGVIRAGVKGAGIKKGPVEKGPVR